MVKQFAIVSCVNAANSIEIDVIASKWIVDDKFYYFPPSDYKPAERRNALEKCYDFDAERWDKFEIKRIYRNDISMNIISLFNIYIN